MTDMQTFPSEKDEYGDKMFFVYEYNHFWIDNFNDCRLKKEQMIDFLEKCLDFVKGCK